MPPVHRRVLYVIVDVGAPAVIVVEDEALELDDQLQPPGWSVEEGRYARRVLASRSCSFSRPWRLRTRHFCAATQLSARVVDLSSSLFCLLSSSSSSSLSPTAGLSRFVVLAVRYLAAVRGRIWVRARVRAIGQGEGSGLGLRGLNSC